MQYKVCLLLGHTYRVIGEIDKAKKCYKKAETIGKDDTMEDCVTLAVIYQQMCVYATGNNNEPIEKLKPLVSNNALSVSTRGILHQVLGNVYRSAADWHHSKYHFNESICLAKEENDQHKVMERLAELGRVYRSSGCHNEALTRQKAFLKFSVSHGYLYSIGAACGYIGFTYYSMGKSHYEDAVKFLYCRLELSRSELNDVAGYRWCLNNLGKVYLGLNEHKLCMQLFTESAEIAKDIGNMLGLGTAYGNLGTACRAVGRHNEAIKYHKLYLHDIAEKTSDTGGVSIMQNELILDYLFIYKEKKERAEKDSMLETARRYACQALRTGLEVRSRLGKEDDLLKIGNFEKNQARTYALLQFILVEQGEYKAALLVSELGRARALADLVEEKLKAYSQFLSDIVDIFNLDGSFNCKQMSSAMVQLNSLLQSLKSHLLIYSIVDNPLNGKETLLYTWYVHPVSDCLTDEVKLHFNQVSLSQKNGDKAECLAFNEEYVTSLMHEVRSTSSQLIKTAESGTDNVPSRDIIRRKMAVVASEKSPQPEKRKDKLEELYSLLIEPMSKHMLFKDVDVTRLIIIPQGFLFSVPFPALKGPGHYLIEKFILSLSPSIYLLQLALQKEKTKFSTDLQTDLSILAVGNPQMPLDEIEQLPGAENEAKSIIDIVRGKLLCGVEATKTDVVNSLPHFSVIHLATHAILEDSLSDHLASSELTTSKSDGDYGIKGAIVLAKSNSSCSGVLTSSEIKELNLNCELFVLSCCNTARGKVTQDGILGLSRSLMCAGATNMIVTLWPIHDSSTALLMKNFYSEYKLSRDAPAALRHSMLSLIKKQYKVERWAAFCNLGI